jgi:shikimate kinase
MNDHRGSETARVWLAGLMGCGKSTVGPVLAGQLGFRYVDNDAAIGAMTGQSSTSLSLARGSALHDREQQYVRELARAEPFIVAGIPASAADRPADLDLLVATGFLVYLRAEPGILISRTAADPPRPWLADSPAQVQTTMFRRRDPVLTGRAHLVVSAAQPVAEITALITDAAKASRGAPPESR